jgi:hypothetical protein
LKTLRGRQYSFEKLTQFSLGNKMPDTLPSNTDGFLPRDIGVSIILLYRPFLIKMNSSVT